MQFLFPFHAQKTSVVFLVFILLLGFCHLQSQDIIRVTISGKIIDVSTQKPLEHVNVFLSNTTLGDVTNEDGIYIIKHVPAGVYELVISMMGYELQTMTIYLDNDRDRIYNIGLKAKYLQGEEVSVTSTIPKDWKKNLEKFEKVFLGSSRNADECNILNPEYLDLTYDPESGILSASSSEALHIENRSLGYMISYHLADFTSIDDGGFQYFGRVKFDSLSANNDKERDRWVKNRKETFQGSFRHFITSLAAGQLFEEGFMIFGVEKHTQYDQVFYLDQATSDTLMAPGKKPNERILSFPSSFSVIYDGKISRVEMRQAFVTINTLGQVYNPYALVVYGVWAKESVSDKLPYSEKYIKMNSPEAAK